ncbi:hypothetical protein OCD90_28395 [Bacillus pacificus]|uniref:hypothetical protein n=1 Tax=Bacillus TaxID=1386 RepID=UPI0012629198|nr:MULTISPECIES: hypothetical protein [Bacillus]KAB7629982.1 hypothetical protein GBN96_28820 [Bacillus sp. B4-WWTP-NA-D-NA-NA]MCC2414371.1 hypothetical protein [Bacillus paranthracis]MCU5259653.1 hypothetical protein [Bacillus pacificus]
MLGLGNNSYKKLLFSLLGGTFMFFDEENSHENDEIKEFKTISIEEAVKLQKIKRKQEQEAFEKRLAELKKKTADLKKQLKDKHT